MEVDPHQWCSGAPPDGGGLVHRCANSLVNSQSPGLYFVLFVATGVVQDGESNPSGAALDLRSLCFVVKTLHRTNLVLDLPGTTTIAALKAIIADAEGIPVAKQRLLLGGRDVMGGQTLAAARIMADSTLELALRLVGGMPPKQSASERLSFVNGALVLLAADSPAWFPFDFELWYCCKFVDSTAERANDAAFEPASEESGEQPLDSLL